MSQPEQLPLLLMFDALPIDARLRLDPDSEPAQVVQTLASLRRLQTVDPLAFTAYSQQVLNRLRAATRDFERELRLS